MASQPRPEIPVSFRCEFDRASKIMLIQFKGRVTNEVLEVSYRTAQRYATLMDASASIMDCSLVTEFDVSADLIRQLANQEPVLSDPTRPRFIIASKTLVFGLARMFQIMGEHSRPLLKVVRTMDEALVALGVKSLHFEPLE
ncbi:MAG: hypothetical protein WAM13_19230 [Candidatus Sulfotelmatobacter sp.]|jgi:hypothetical protein